jgi:hypothetical protein
MDPANLGVYEVQQGSSMKLVIALLRTECSEPSKNDRRIGVRSKKSLNIFQKGLIDVCISKYI